MSFEENTGLYDENANSRGDCAVMGSQDLSGNQSHQMQDDGLRAAERLAHRGGLIEIENDAAGNPVKGTSHGVGQLTDIPLNWMRKTAEALFDGYILSPDMERYVIAPFFWHGDIGQQVRTVVGTALQQFFDGDIRIEWRNVPVNTSVLGPKGLATMPKIRQLWFIAEKGATSELNLMKARKFVERHIAASGLDATVLSMSAETIVYKGLMLPQHLGHFFPDLMDSTFEISGGIWHVRMATNTFPKWELAHPGRLLAHNGEINTNWTACDDMSGISAALEARQDVSFLPLYAPEKTDSANADLRFEATALSTELGLPYAVAAHMPKAWERAQLSDAERAFWISAASRCVPSEGPAAIYCKLKHQLVVTADRFSLRPIRWARVGNIVYAASEIGAWLDEMVEEMGEISGGQILVADSKTGMLRVGQQVIEDLVNAKDWQSLVANVKPAGVSTVPAEDLSFAKLLADARAYGWDRHSLQLIAAPMAASGKEPTFAMGRDVPLASFSNVDRGLQASLMTLFSQITNPPTDYKRERRLFALRTWLGPKGDLFSLEPIPLGYWFESPVLNRSQWHWFLRKLNRDTGRIHAVHRRELNTLESMVHRITQSAKDHVQAGKRVILVDCSGAGSHGVQAVPAALAVRAVRNGLLEAGAQRDVRIVLSSGEIKTATHLATAIAAGADLVYPGLLYDLVEMHATDSALDLGNPDDIEAGLKAGLEDGLIQCMCRLGIATVDGYRGSMLLETSDLSANVCEFFGLAHKVGRRGFAELEQAYAAFAASAGKVTESLILPVSGVIKAAAQGGERHRFDTETQVVVQRAAYLREPIPEGILPDPERFLAVQRRAMEMGVFSHRDMLEIFGNLGPAQNVEWTSIAPHGNCGSMSLGALNPFGHLHLTMGFNYVGSTSSGGEGGVPEERFHPPLDGLPSAACIRGQKASGQWGVTLKYYTRFGELEIKFVQAAKPGLGGQLPGRKVWHHIAETRGVQPGQELISPPPQHKMYSIEDVQQEVHHLKQINPDAKIWLKVAARTGIGAIACGAAACGADGFLVCGVEGGTGASPFGPIQYSGIPVEYAVKEVHEALCLHGLRQHLTVGVDGGLGLSAEEIVKLAMCGAQVFGMGTVPMMTLGCIKANTCFADCPVDLATGTGENLPGTWQNVALYLTGLYMAVAELTGSLGAASFDELVGQAHMLRPKEDICRAYGYERSDFRHLLSLSAEERAHAGNLTADTRNTLGFHQAPTPAVTELSNKVIAADITKPASITLETPLLPRDRSLGAREFGTWARADYYPVDLTIYGRGMAGQDLTSHACEGVTFVMEGAASDYSATGLSGGRLFLKAPAHLSRKAHRIVGGGNLVMQAAAAGTVVAGYRLGNRTALLNRGGVLIGLGAGSELGEYMVGGRVTMFGEIGDNAGAGMSGGVHFLPKSQATKINPEDVEARELDAEDWKIVEGDIATFLEHIEREALDAALEAIGGGDRSNFVKVVSKMPLADVSHMDEVVVDYGRFVQMPAA